MNKAQLDALLKKLPIKNRLQILKTMPELHLLIQLLEFLQHVGFGQQKEAEVILKNNPEIAQKLLSNPGTFLIIQAERLTATLMNTLGLQKTSTCVK